MVVHVPSARTTPAREPAAAAGERTAEICFPELDGRRSTTATCRGILADAARVADERLARRIEDSESWRSDYVAFLGELTELGSDRERALAIAHAGLASMRARLVVEGDDRTRSLADVLAGEASERAARMPRLGTGEVRGAGVAPARLEIPYRGALLHGRALSAQLDRWAQRGIVEPSFAAAVAEVADHPEWLSLPGRTVVLVGAGSEIGPLGPLCAWGADVLAIDLPRAAIWERIAATARSGSGTLRMPVAADGTAGLDVVAELAEARAWIASNLGERAPLLGMYGYADGGAHVLLTAAFDALAESTTASEPAAALAYLATPTDAYLVPAADVDRARAAYRGRRARAVVQAPLKMLSGGRLYRPAYGGEAPLADALVAQQGPNYALAKRMQRWRGVSARAAGTELSFNVAPATWTRSVTKNRVLASAYAGARHFGIEIFAPETTRALMGAMLVHDMHRAPLEGSEPEALFSEGAAHGGLWTAAYEPRSALGLAALVGFPATALGRARAHEPKEQR